MKDMVEKAKTPKQQYSHSSKGVFFTLNKCFGQQDDDLLLRSLCTYNQNAQ